MPPSVADELLLQSLAQEIQDAITRVYGSPLPGNPRYTDADMERAYAAGFENAVDQMEPSYPYYDSGDFTAWMKYRR
jgi:hypothetical protein